MSLAQALDEVLVRLEGGQDVVTVGHEVTVQWSEGALATLVASGLLRPASAAQSVVCDGCELRCFQDVVMRPVRDGVNRAFVICDVPGVQEVMGRIPVALERLRQWYCTRDMLAGVLCDLLGLSGEPVGRHNALGIALGMVKTSRGRRWVHLKAVPLVLAMNGQGVPVRELLYADGDEIVLDRARINTVLAADPGTGDKAYVPNTDRREARKRETEAMYQDWRDAYAQLQKAHPDKGKTWCATRIARMEIAQGRDSETIRRRLP